MVGNNIIVVDYIDYVVVSYVIVGDIVVGCVVIVDCIIVNDVVSDVDVYGTSRTGGSVFVGIVDGGVIVGCGNLTAIAGAGTCS